VPAGASPLTPAARVTSPGPRVRLGSSHDALRLLHGVEMDLTVELGRARLPVRELLGLVPGSVVELDRQAGAPVDILVNGTLLAKGEVVVVDDEFGVRITEIVQTEPVAPES
ncbi:MAG: flagellar motor switch protein FliN, partial [Acidimicrobiales bacterium]